MKHRVIAGALSIWAASTAMTAPASPKVVLDDVAADIRAQCTKGEFSGTVIVLRRGRELLHVSCQPQEAPPIAAATKFKFFSMSKMFTGLAVARLVEQGRIDPEAPIGRYLPELPADWSGIKVSDLLHHVSGVRDLTQQIIDQFQAGARTHHAAMEQVLRKAATDKSPLQFVTGSKFAYNNFGYELLAQIASNVAQKPFDQVLRELVLVPAGMRSATIAMPLFTDGKLDGSQPVDGLVQGFNGKPGALQPANSFSFVQLGAGAVIGNASDMIAFDHALATHRIVSAATADMLGRTAYAANERVH